MKSNYRLSLVRINENEETVDEISSLSVRFNDEEYKNNEENIKELFETVKNLMKKIKNDTNYIRISNENK